jgi:hypothetical protein
LYYFLYYFRYYFQFIISLSYQRADQGVRPAAAGRPRVPQGAPAGDVALGGHPPGALLEIWRRAEGGDKTLKNGLIFFIKNVILIYFLKGLRLVFFINFY